jgi:hypothetical protein
VRLLTFPAEAPIGTHRTQMTTAESQEFSTVTVGSNRSFGAVFVGVFALIGLFPLIKGGEPRLWALLVSAGFLVPTLLFPAVLRPLNVAWFRFGMLLGRIVNPVVMFVIYAVAILPMGLLLRLLGKDMLRQRFDPAADSYWIVRDPPGPTPASMEDQF